jgi:hypothetical protein
VGSLVRDPGISVGPYRVLERTDRRWALLDPRLPPGSQTAAVRATKAEIIAEAKRLVDFGEPMVTAPPEELYAGMKVPKVAVAAPEDDGGDRPLPRASSRAPAAQGEALSKKSRVGRDRGKVATRQPRLGK